MRSGQVASEYFDKYLFEAQPDLLARVVEQMVPLLPEGTEVLGGLELGGVPIATILSARTGLPGLFVRKKAKDYGTCKLAEGGDVSGRQVTLIEDVITTGGAVRDATNALRAEGAIVAHRRLRDRPQPRGQQPARRRRTRGPLGVDQGVARLGDRMSGRKPRVAVVFGGRSSEHSISCISAGSVLKAIDREKYDVVPVGITTTGQWVLENPDTNRLELGPGGELPSVVGSSELALVHGESSELVVHEPGNVPKTLGEVDVVFPVMHGPWGQDGTLQGLLEMAGVRYVGAGVLASAVGTDKVFMKRLFQAAELDLLPYVVLTPRGWATEQAETSLRHRRARDAGLREAREGRIVLRHQPGRLARPARRRHRGGAARSTRR